MIDEVQEYLLKLWSDRVKDCKKRSLSVIVVIKVGEEQKYYIGEIRQVNEQGGKVIDFELDVHAPYKEKKEGVKRFELSKIEGVTEHRPFDVRFG
jgi:hypothetical protein